VSRCNHVSINVSIAYDEETLYQGVSLFHEDAPKVRLTLFAPVAHRVGSEEVTTFLLPKFPLRDAKKLREKMLS
jgi:hypothetical protein